MPPPEPQVSASVSRNRSRGPIDRLFPRQRWRASGVGQRRGLCRGAVADARLGPRRPPAGQPGNATPSWWRLGRRQLGRSARTRRSTTDRRHANLRGRTVPQPRELTNPEGRHRLEASRSGEASSLQAGKLTLPHWLRGGRIVVQMPQPRDRGPAASMRCRRRRAGSVTRWDREHQIWIICVRRPVRSAQVSAAQSRRSGEGRRGSPVTLRSSPSGAPAITGAKRRGTAVRGQNDHRGWSRRSSTS